MPNKVAKLLKTMYGTEDASNIWGDTWPNQLESEGMSVGVANRALFEGKGVMGFCHGDDFLAKGTDRALNEFGKLMAEKFELREVAGIGFGEGVGKALIVLGKCFALSVTATVTTVFPHQLFEPLNARQQIIQF